MNERDLEPPRPADESEVRRLMQAAGRRPPIPAEDLDAIEAAARAAWRRQVDGSSELRRRRRLRTVTWGLAAAATMAITVGLTRWLGPAASVPPPVGWVELVRGSVEMEAEGSSPRPLVRGQPIPRNATLRSAGLDSGRLALRLAGGSSLRLDQNSEVRVIAANALELGRGALYIDSGGAPRAQAAVEVRTFLGTARDVGTQFAVRLVEPPSSAGTGVLLLVRVRTGAVETSRGGRAYLTPAGQELLLRADGSAEQRAADPFGPDWRWVLEAGPRFEIEGRRLGEFLDWVARETGWTLRFAEDASAVNASDIVLHGSFGDLPPDQAPFVVLPGARLDAVLEHGTLIIRRR